MIIHRISANRMWIADPARGKLICTHNEFSVGWILNKVNQEGTIVCFAPI
jgi:hypothetical protein